MVISFPAGASQLNELKSLTLEQLANMEVSIASKSSQAVDSIPAAVFVLTSEDIRRSTASSIPELLQLVPGLNVARIDSSHWAISARGFNGRYANKLLVLMDGRSVYTPLFSGVYWNVQDTLLDDIERIEVIRGPGATVWGANAVNGVINIITRSAENTQGNLLSTSFGRPEKYNMAIRHGGEFEQNVHYRVFAKFRRHRELESNREDEALDKWHDKRFGFRVDGQFNNDDDFTIQGDIYRNVASQNSLFPDVQFGQVSREQTFDDNGGNILSKWGHQFDNNDQSSLQVYYDYQRRDEANDRRYTFDLDFNYQFAPQGNHHVIFGFGYRFTHDKTKGQIEQFQFYPVQRAQRILSAFVQDEIQFHPQWAVTIGSKFEHHKYTGFEVQPSVRLFWTPQQSQSYWLAFSRASRVPSRAETGIRGSAEAVLADPPSQLVPALITGVGNPQQKSEIVHTYEVGYRYSFNQQLSIDISTFYNDYKNLQTIEPGELDFSNFPFYVEQLAYFDNKVDGKTWGVELVSDWRIDEEWRLQSAYSFLKMRLNKNNNSLDQNVFALEHQSPKQQLSIRLAYTPNYAWETDLWLRYVDDIDVNDIEIPSYWRFDARIAYQLTNSLQISLVGQNLFDSQHPEFNDELDMISYTEIPRSFYLKAVWRY